MNINAAEKLLSKYKEITLEQLEERFELLEEILGESCTGVNVMETLTGFGTYSTCMLCLEAKKLSHTSSNCCKDFCGYCVYKLNNTSYPYCLDDLYNKMRFSSNAEELYEALQKRINYLEQIIKIYYEKSKRNI